MKTLFQWLVLLIAAWCIAVGGVIGIVWLIERIPWAVG